MVALSTSGRRTSLERVVLATVVALGGCSLVVSTSGLSSGDTDGGAPTSVTEAGDGGSVSDADGSAFVPCSLDGAATPLRVFDPLLDVPDAAPPCNAGDVLVTDDKGAGLDILGYSRFTKLAGAPVTACVGVEFGAPLTRLTVRLRAVASACGQGCAGNECGQGRFAVAFLGPTRATLRSTGSDINVDGTFKDYALQATPADRVVIICRFASSAGKDDIEVDSIIGGCRP